jgi:hypothetical protein
MNSGKRVIGGLAIVLLFVMFVPATEAGPWGFGPKRQESWQSDLQPARRSPESDEGQEPHHQRHGKKDAQQRPQRLSPEEHSKLRRDIKDAGKEIYPDHSPEDGD